MVHSIGDFKEIISKKITITEWANKNHTTKQNVSMILKKNINDFVATEEYINFLNSFSGKESKILRIDNKTNDKMVIDVFCYTK